jgi:type III secretion system YscD/HrpQ family protein
VTASQHLILRILSGPNTGAEAVLSGRLVVGSADTADIVISDPALKPEHFTILPEGSAASVLVGDAPLFIKGEARRNGAYKLVPFDLVKFGSTCLAIGPQGADWPTFSQADLLPEASNTPKPVAPATEVSTRQSAAVALPGGSRSLAAPGGGGRRRVQVATFMMALVAAVVFAAGYMFFVESTLPAGGENVAPLALARDIVRAAGASGVEVVQNSDGALAIEGFVETTDEQQRLRQALLSANLPIEYRVVSLEQQVSAVRTEVASTGAKLSVTTDPKKGSIIIEGILPGLSHFEGLKQSLLRDIPDLRPLDLRVVTPEQVVRETREKLAAAGLESATKIEASPEGIRIVGALDEGKRATVARIVSELNDRFAGAIKVENATTLAKAPVPLPRSEVTVQASSPIKNVTIVVTGKNGFFIDAAGQRYSVGGKLANGEVIEHIDTDQVVTLKDGVKRRYTLGGGP